MIRPFTIQNISVFLFLFFLPICVFSQQSIPASSLLKLDYKNVTKNSPRNIQLLFFTVSNTTVNDKSYNDIAIDVRFRGRSAGANIFAVALFDAKVSPQVLYRQFDISDFLIPDLFSLNVECLSENKKTYMYFENISITKEKEMYFSYDEDRVQLRDLSIVRFNYSDSSTAQFESAVRKINDFHASKRLFEYLINKHKQLPENDLIALINSWDISRKALATAVRFEPSFLENNLQEKETFETLFDQLKRLNTRYKTLLNIELDKKERQITHSKQLIDSYFEHMQQLKIDATKLELRDSEIFNQVAEIDIDNEFKALLRRITASQSLPFLETDFFDAIFEKSCKKINESSYTEALEMLKALYNFDIVHNNEIKLKPVKQQEEICKSGLLRDYFRVASRAIETENQLLAKQYIQKTVEFYQTECITSMYTNIQRESEPLFAAMQQKGATLLNEKKIHQAISILEEGKRLSEIFKNTIFKTNFDELLRYAHHEVYWDILADAKQHVINRNAEMANVLIESALQYASQNATHITNTDDALMLRSQNQKPIYDEMLENSLTMAQNGDRQHALMLLQNANQLSNEYSIETEINKDSVNLVVTKPLILNTLRSSYVKIWSNDLDEAWRIYSEARQIAEEFSLMNDEDIKHEFQGFDKKIIERICLNCKLEYDELMQTIEVKAEQQKLFELRQALSRAETMVNQNQGCNIDSHKLNEYKQRYSAVFEYEARYNAVLNVLYSEGFKTCIPHYLALDKEVEQRHQNYKNIHKTIFDFIKDQQNATLTLMALSYFLEKRDEIALQKCLLLLVGQHFSTTDYSDTLRELGTFFAHIDIKNGSSIIEYIPDNKNFKSFIKSYYKNYK